MFQSVVIGQVRETKPNITVIQTAAGHRLSIAHLDDSTAAQRLTKDQEQRRLRIAALS